MCVLTGELVGEILVTDDLSSSPVQLMRIPAERPSSSFMFFRLFSTSSTVLKEQKIKYTNLQRKHENPFLFTLLSVCAYVRKSLTSSTVSSPVESRVRSAQLRGESSGVSRMGDDRELGGSGVRAVEERSRKSWVEECVTLITT